MEKENSKNAERPFREMQVCYIVEMEDENNQIAWSGYIRHFLIKNNPEQVQELKIDGPLLAVTMMEMPFETIEYCLYAMMQLLKTNTLYYTKQSEKELIEKNLSLNLIKVHINDILPGIEKLFPQNSEEEE